jgi:hypothetical protein
MKLKLIALAAFAVISAPSSAAIADASTGNGELVANFRLYSADGDNNNGGDDISALFDLGITINSFLADASVAGYTRTWDLTAANYGNAWGTLTNFNVARNSAIQYNVIALDNTNSLIPGGARYMSTSTTSTFGSLVNANLLNFQNMNTLLVANQTRGTHATEENGASTATSAGPLNTYFGKTVNGLMDGDNWGGQTIVDTTKELDVSQYFFLLTNSSTVSTAQAARINLGVWYVSGSDLTFVAAVPEPETYAMLLTGLGLMGAVVRRRKQKSMAA